MSSLKKFFYRPLPISKKDSYRQHNTYGSLAWVVAACKNDSAIKIRLVCREKEYLSKQRSKIFFLLLSNSVGSACCCCWFGSGVFLACWVSKSLLVVDNMRAKAEGRSGQEQSRIVLVHKGREWCILGFATDLLLNMVCKATKVCCWEPWMYLVRLILKNRFWPRKWNGPNVKLVDQDFEIDAS